MCEEDIPITNPISDIYPRSFTVYHVPCSQITVNARNFASFDGQWIRSYPGGTILYGYAVPPRYTITPNAPNAYYDDAGTPWVRITGHEAYPIDNTLFIRSVDSDGNPLITIGTPTGPCLGLTPVPFVTPQPTATVSVGVVPPGCQGDNYCPLVNETPSVEDIVAFVLACEAGSDDFNSPIFEVDFVDAVNIAYVIRNRMKSGLFRGSALEVVQQAGQFDCYLYGTEQSNLATLSAIPATIRELARQLIQGQPLTAQPTSLNIRWYGLYTVGIGSDAAGRQNFTETEILNLVTTQMQCTPEEGLLVSFAPFKRLEEGDLQVFDYTTVYFSDDPSC
jgi:hypothetical protein